MKHKQKKLEVIKSIIDKINNNETTNFSTKVGNAPCVIVSDKYITTMKELDGITYSFTIYEDGKEYTLSNKKLFYGNQHNVHANIISCHKTLRASLELMVALIESEDIQ